MAISGDIRLNKPSTVYYAGETLRGTVHLIINHDIFVKNIHIYITGEAEVCWTEHRKGIEKLKQAGNLNVYQNEKILLPYKDYFTEHCEMMTLRSGSYNYPFECRLPPSLPTSFYSKSGYIDYMIKVQVCRKAYQEPFLKWFTVINPVNLNLYPNCRQPGEISEMKTFFSFCCRSGPLRVKLTTPQTGYVPGQKIHFKLSINNESIVNIDQTCVGFNRKTIYESESGHTKKIFENISKENFGSLLKFAEKEFRGHITLPSMPPTSMHNLKWLRYSYYLYAYILTAGTHHNNIRIVIPIKIGTTPLLYEPHAPEAPTLETIIEIPTAPPETPNSETPIQIATAPLETPTSETQMEIPTGPLETPMVILDQPRPTTIRPTLVTSMGLERDRPPSYDSLQPPTYEKAIQFEVIPPEPDYNGYGSGPFTPRYPVFHNWDRSDISDSEID